MAAIESRVRNLEVIVVGVDGKSGLRGDVGDLEKDIDLMHSERVTYLRWAIGLMLTIIVALMSGLIAIIASAPHT